jgi:hypothetical protein
LPVQKPCTYGARKILQTSLRISIDEALLVSEKVFQGVWNPICSSQCLNISSGSCWAHRDAIRCSFLLSLVWIHIVGMNLPERARSSLLGMSAHHDSHLTLYNIRPLCYLQLIRRNISASPLATSRPSWTQIWRLPLWTESFACHFNCQRQNCQPCRQCYHVLRECQRTVN